MESDHSEHVVHHLPALCRRGQVASLNDLRWKIAIYLQPTTAVQIIIITISILLVILGASIIWLHLGEKREDKKNQINLKSVFV